MSIFDNPRMLANPEELAHFFTRSTLVHEPYVKAVDGFKKTGDYVLDHGGILKPRSSRFLPILLNPLWLPFMDLHEKAYEYACSSARSAQA